MSYVEITAHSGCENTPENSMESVRKGISLGADCVEIDIHMDEKGALFLSHDAKVDYTHAVPLQQALSAIAQSSVAVNCDLKEKRVLYRVLDMAEKCSVPRERLIFSGSVDIALLLKDPQIARRVRIFLNSEEICYWLAPELPDERWTHTRYLTDEAGKTAAFLRELGVEALNAPYKYATDTWMEAMGREGVALSLWTVNDEEDQKRLLCKDIQNLTTRSVGTALRLRRQIAMGEQRHR